VKGLGFKVERRKESIRLPNNVSPNWVVVRTTGYRQDIFYGERGEPTHGHTVIDLSTGEIKYARTMKGTVLVNKR